MSTIQTYDRVGIAEDVSDIITNIDPTSTPFQTMIGTGKVHNTFYQWQEDDYRGVKVNAAVEGADGVATTRGTTTMRGNHTQILEETFQISDRTERVKLYGRRSETRYQSAKVAKELKRDLEHALIGRAQNAAAGDASTASFFGNVFGQDAGPSGAANMVETRAALGGEVMTEEDLLSLHQSLYLEGSNPTTLMITPLDSLSVAEFAASAGRERDFGHSKKVVNVVDLYVSPFGEVKVVLNRFLQAYIADDADVPGEQVDPTATNDPDTNPDQLGTAILFDPSMWQLVSLRPWRRTKLAKTGDAEKYQMLGEYGLKHKNYLCSGVFTGIGQAPAT
ncbi:MAG: DUF5309 family protein [Pseudomonadota bacterium]